jgi:hypothetical protein
VAASAHGAGVHSVQVANQINTAAQHDHGWNGPHDDHGHVHLLWFPSRSRLNNFCKKLLFRARDPLEHTSSPAINFGEEEQPWHKLAIRVSEGVASSLPRMGIAWPMISRRCSPRTASQ